MSKQDFDAIAAERAKEAPSREDVESAHSKIEAASREERLRQAGLWGEGPIPEEDLRRLVDGEALVSSQALRAVQRWFRIRGGGGGGGERRTGFTILALCGEMGRGKTFAGAWLLAQLGGRYISAEEMRRTYVRFSPNDADVSRAKRARVLVIDDLGTELDAEEGAAALFDLLNKRMGNPYGWTLLTANLLADEFTERYGERTIERIKQCGAFMEVSGPNLRVARREES